MQRELISEEDFVNLPENDEKCFVAFEAICRRNMLRMIDENTSNDFDQVVRQQYMAAVTSVAQECGIPNVTYDPTSEDIFWQQFHVFSLKVQGEVARIRIRQRGDRDAHSVLLTGSTRTKIEHYISRIRDMIDRSDMDDDRKKKLHEKLDILSKELSNQRFSFARSMAVLVTLATTLAAVTTIAADGQNAISHIMQLIGQDKDTEEAAAKRLAPTPRARPAPTEKSFQKTASKSSEAPVQSDDFDDDIPF